MLRQLFRTMLDASVTLGVDADLRVGWSDILDNLAPLPTATVVLDGVNTTILADWEGAGPPPKNDRQMLSAVQPIYPAGEFWVSMANQTQLQIARDTMKYLDWYSVQSDAFCIMYTISARLGENQTLVFPRMVRTNLQFGFSGNSFLPNLMTLPQIGPAAVQYVNELFLQSHEAFVRVYPAHFSDTGVRGGPPRGPGREALAGDEGQSDRPVGDGGVMVLVVLVTGG